MVLDPVDPAVRDGARDLADQLGSGSEVERAVQAMLTEVARGVRVVVLRAEDDVTPAQAARMLGVSRQFVDRLCADEVLPFNRLPDSQHRRIRVQDVIGVAAERDRRRAGADAIRAAIADLGA